MSAKTRNGPQLFIVDQSSSVDSGVVRLVRGWVAKDIKQLRLLGYVRLLRCTSVISRKWFPTCIEADQHDVLLGSQLSKPSCSRDAFCLG